MRWKAQNEEKEQASGMLLNRRKAFRRQRRDREKTKGIHGSWPISVQDLCHSQLPVIVGNSQLRLPKIGPKRTALSPAAGGFFRNVLDVKRQRRGPAKVPLLANPNSNFLKVDRSIQLHNPEVG